MTTKNELYVYILEQGYGLDSLPATEKKPYANQRFLEDYQKDPGLALLLFGFDPPSLDMSPGLTYLHGIARRFIQTLTQNAEGDFAAVQLVFDEEQMAELLQQTPYVIGVEFINNAWLTGIWETLAAAFKTQGEQYDSITEFLTAHDPNLIIFGRVYFHLVESPSEDFPFAFLATYSTTTGKGRKKKASHVPLINALMEFAGQRESLLKLLATVSRAVEQSNLISDLVESGEIFHPLKFSPNEAYTFLREIPLYEECGIICRMPDWWRKKTHSPRLSVSIGEKP
ncbi:MAG: SNF2 helicase-associated domain-containing protein, partial [Peptococcaceae bacterium]|nr:SNF2 helicase-associated domain-containing protein [Peptococcaceae bacterium]